MPGIRDIWLHAHNTIRSARQIINENLSRLELGSAEGNILLHLWTRGQSMGQEHLVAQLDISKPAVSRALASLEKKGYVVRQQDPHDKRARRVCLTPKAIEIGPAIEQIYNRVYQVAARGISQADVDRFTDLFSRISRNLGDEQAKKE